MALNDIKVKAAASLNTASEARFQCQLPFEPVDRPRLEMLKAERLRRESDARTATPAYVRARRRAQIQARHALEEPRVVPWRARAEDLSRAFREAGCERGVFEAVHAAELQLPESWLAFVVAR